MGDSVKAQLGRSLPLLSGNPARMAKAALDLPRKTRKEERWALVGPAIDRCRTLVQLSLKEFADAIGHPESQVRDWIRGEERPQLDAIFAVPAFREPLVQALGELAGTIEIETVLRIRRRA